MQPGTFIVTDQNHPYYLPMQNDLYAKKYRKDYCLEMVSELKNLFQSNEKICPLSYELFCLIKAIHAPILWHVEKRKECESEKKFIFTIELFSKEIEVFDKMIDLCQAHFQKLAELEVKTFNVFNIREYWIGVTVRFSTVPHLAQDNPLKNTIKSVQNFCQNKFREKVDNNYPYLESAVFEFLDEYRDSSLVISSHSSLKLTSVGYMLRSILDLKTLPSVWKNAVNKTVKGTRTKSSRHFYSI